MKDRISRRGVIGLGVGAAALSAVGRTQPSGGVGFAVVGLGKLAQGQIIPGFANCRNARLAALVSGHPEKANRIAAEHRLPSSAVYNYDNFDRIAADPEIDVVYIVLPNFLHAEYTIRALKAGKHVLCEKPMATTVSDAEAMIAAAKVANRKLMIAYRCHYEPLNLEAMRRVRSGSLGKPRLVITKMVRQSDLSDPSDAWRLDMHQSGGGALADMGIYGVSGARYLLDEEPVEVRATARTNRNDPRFKTVEDLIAWEFRFASGAIAQGSTSFDAADEMAFEVIGQHKRLVADPGCFYNGNHLYQWQGGSRTEIPVHEIDQFAREMDWMADVVRGRAPLVSPGEEGLQDMRLMHAILESVREGGAAVNTDWGYRRAVDPAMAVA
jgi:predicted dehydrogenase